MSRSIHISIFLAKTPHYDWVLPQMMAGFTEVGFTVTGQTGLLDEQGVHAWLREKKPDVVFEYNRTRKEAPYWPRDVKHLAWVVDMAGRTEHDLRESDVLYFFAWHELGTYPYTDTLVRQMSPAVCPHTFRPAPSGEQRIESDMCFIGHVTRPWSEEELERNVSSTSQVFAFRELLPLFTHAYYTRRFRFRRDIRDTIDEIMNERTGGPLRDVPAVVYDLLDRVPRMERHTMIKEAVVSRCSLRLFGTESVAAWPEFRKFYRGYLTDPIELCRVYQTSRITLHNGVAEHFRAFEAMRAGSLLFYWQRPQNHSPLRTDPEALRLLELQAERRTTAQANSDEAVLVPNADYAVFHVGELAETMARYVGTPLGERMRQAAFDKVTRYHTWACRAREVARDLTLL